MTREAWFCQRCGDRKLVNGDDAIEREFDRAKDRGWICDPCQRARARKVSPLDVRAVFAPGGPLARGNPKFEARPGQVKLAEAVWSALEGRRHVLAEGPCGIGKSKAYGIPASYFASQGKKVLIVTASIALQEQLIKKDLPELARELPWKFAFAMLKGRSNYVCKSMLRSLEEQLADGDSFGDDPEPHDVLEWARRTETGDRSELPARPSLATWGQFSVGSDECPGRKKCPHGKECFSYRAKDAASASGIIVTNYHMFFLDRAIGGGILPTVDAVILDEAHEAADIARDVLGWELGPGRFRRLASMAKEAGFHEGAADVRAHADRFFGELLRIANSKAYEASKILRDEFLDTCPRELFDAASELRRSVLRLIIRKSPPPAPVILSGERAVEGLVSCLNLSDENMVYYLKKKQWHGRDEASIVARYVHPSTSLRGLVWDTYSTVAAVSATLTTDGSFDFARSELGAPDDADEIVVESPFDFARNAIVVVPPLHSLPEPNDPTFPDAVARKTIETIEAAGGRTLGLFTSNRMLSYVHAQVERHFRGRYKILRQGELEITKLVEQFKADRSSVLLGVASLWTGVDVPGDACAAVVIDRLPFTPPDDPVMLRISETLRSKAFAKHMVPRSILTVRQGVGRLIRTAADVGAVVLLDPRLTSKGYGSRFLKSLPPMRRVSSVGEIRPFLESHGAP